MSSIDVDGIWFKNWDEKQYQDKKALDIEKLELTAQLKNIRKLEDGTYHPADLMAHKIQIHVEEENRRSLTFVKKEDSKAEILFKHYESLVSYNVAFQELIDRAKEYLKLEEHESVWIANSEKLSKLQANINTVINQGSMMNSHFNNIRNKVFDTVQLQLSEYMSGVNNHPNYGIDVMMSESFSKLHNNVDALIVQLDEIQGQGDNFTNVYMKEIEDKAKYYEEQKQYFDSDHAKAEKEKKDKEKASGPVELPKTIINDIKFGADNIRVAIKEKHLGREQGKKRGETAVMYSNDILTIIMSSFMIVILMYVSRQVEVHAKNKLF